MPSSGMYAGSELECTSARSNKNRREYGSTRPGEISLDVAGTLAAAAVAVAVAEPETDDAVFSSKSGFGTSCANTKPPHRSSSSASALIALEICSHVIVTLPTLVARYMGIHQTHVRRHKVRAKGTGQGAGAG
jgi:hypothetical protein